MFDFPTMAYHGRLKSLKSFATFEQTLPFGLFVYSMAMLFFALPHPQHLPPFPLNWGK